MVSYEVRSWKCDEDAPSFAVGIQWASFGDGLAFVSSSQDIKVGSRRLTIYH